MALQRRARVVFGGPGEPDLLARCDGLDLAAALDDGSCQLVYFDPPFFTGVIRRSRTGAQFSDSFHDLAAYLAFLRPRLEAAHRLLAADGALFVHLDWHASHYVKVELDRIFGARHFVNEIAWCYSVGGKSARAFGRKHDTILFYGRSDDYVFHADAVRVARRSGSHMRVVAGEAGAPVQEKTDRRSGRVYRYPIREGKIPEDWWTDIETLNRSDAERVGYPTQKPVRLLERIVAAASDPGRRVCDLFLGSGTTAVAARRLGRAFAGADVSEEAVRVTVARLEREAQDRSLFAHRPPDVVLFESAAASAGVA